jgi:hypothetical protein
MRLQAVRRWAAVAAGLALVGVTQTVGAPAAPAAAPPALVKASAATPTDSVSPKTAIAVCPAGKRVVGGGGSAINTSPADERRVLLTRLEPVHSGNLDSYVVTGEEISPGIGSIWRLEAYALCAPALPGYQIVSASTTPSSTSVQQAVASCPSPSKVVGTGFQVNNPGGQVTLQTNRTDDPLRIVRAVAKEDANGYSGNWNVTSYAICENLPATFQVVGDGTPTSPEDSKSADVDCPPGKYVHSAGAATSGLPPGLTTTPAGIAVQTVFPSGLLTRVDVFAVATTPTSDSWDVGAFAICGP